ncbi:MAG: cell wall hydrolase [Clostridiales bacterium]|mgnify:FL=1|nr:cell wall hydrolase [Clostridiales bacterium]
MNTIKKLFIAFAAVIVISLGFSHVAYASELTDLEDHFEITDTIEITEKESNALEDAGSQNEAGVQKEADTLNEADIQGDTNSLDVEEVVDSDEFNPDEYEIFIDEQGQVYYLEKEPVEPEIEEIDELIQEELEEEQVKENVKEEKKKPSYSEKDLRLLSCLIYSEAGNQSYKGMLAVANVVLNRVKSSAYYHVNTIEEVIYDNQWAVQFTVTIKSKKTGKSMLDKALESYDTGKFTGKNPAAEKKAMDRAIKAAKAALNGENNIGDYLCFRMNNSGAKSIKKKYSDYKILGAHIFYRTK